MKKNLIALKDNEKFVDVLYLKDHTDLDADITYELASNSRLEVYGIIILKKKSHANVSIKIKHVGKFAFSRVLIKTILMDSSKLDFLGLINIKQSSSGSDAFLAQRSLVLGDNVTVNSTPQLEIENKDVKCSHGVAISQENADQLFYMQSRGIDKVEASNFISNGFVKADFPEDVLKEFGDIQVV